MQGIVVNFAQSKGFGFILRRDMDHTINYHNTGVWVIEFRGFLSHTFFIGRYIHYGLYVFYFCV